MLFRFSRSKPPGAEKPFRAHKKPAGEIKPHVVTENASPSTKNTRCRAQLIPPRHGGHEKDRGRKKTIQSEKNTSCAKKPLGAKNTAPKRIQWRSHQGLSENRSFSIRIQWRSHQSLSENWSFSIRIQWRSHQSLSEKRGFARTLSEALGDGPDF